MFYKVREKDTRIKQLEVAAKEKDNQIKKLNHSLESLRSSISDITTVTENEIQKRIRTAFLNVFTENQTDILLGKKKKVIWKPEEAAKAFSLRYKIIFLFLIY